MAAASKPDGKPTHPPAIERVVRKASAFQHREWVAQRIGWALLALVLIAGVLGLFGDGPLAHRSLENEAAVLEYDRFIRNEADARWRVEIKDVAPGESVRIAIDAAFASHYEFRSIQPTPLSASIDGGRWVYQFDAGDARGTSVLFIVQAEQVGTHAGTIRVNDAPPFMVSQFAYP